MKKYKKILSVILLLSMLFSLFLPTIVHAEERYTLSGTWQFDENITSSASFIDSYLNFTSHTCSSGYNISYSSTYHTIRYMDDELGNVLVYDSSGWKSLKYRTVNFGEVPQEVEKDFYLWFTSVAKKVEVKPSAVIDDLNKDSKFNVNNYPHIADNYGLEIIQIAESNNGELYIYVYQPADSVKDLRATHINMSTHHYEDTTQNYKLYSLTLVSSYGTLDKYVVNDFKVTSDLYRYYNIASIYRAFDESIDTHNAGSDDITGYKGFAVGTCFSAHYYNDVLKYDAKKINVVDVEIKSVGTVRYFNGFKFSNTTTKTDSHYVAFKVTNYDVKNIFDATITYQIADCVINYGLGDSTPKLSNHTNVTKDIHDYEKGSNDGSGLFGYEYEWPRIQTISEFNSMLSEYEHEKVVFNDSELGSAQFVFNFLETDFDIIAGSGYTTYMSDRVTNVGILRLHFATDTVVYNLGAVSDFVSDDGEPDFEIGADDSFQSWLEDLDAYLEDFFKVMFLIILVIIILIFIIYFKPVIILMFSGVTEIFSLIYSTITFPFQLIASAFKNTRR